MVHTFSSNRINRRTVYLTILFIVVCGIALVALILPYAKPLTEETLQVGSVAPQDILAPYAKAYKSEILTENQRVKAAAEVAPIYSQADTGVARRQMERLRVAFSYISAVRADRYASREQQISDLAALKYVHLDQDTIQSILDLSDSRWETVQQESTAVLEQVMRNTIREDKLEDARRGVPALISLSLPEDQANIVALLVTGFVAPNTLYNKTMTEAARQQARAAVTPVSRAFVAGETIVQRGTVITPIDLEALQQFGLLQTHYRTQDIFGAASLVLVVMIFLVVYLIRSHAMLKGPQSARALTLTAILFLVFLISARLSIPGHTVVPYVFPVATYGLIICALFGAEPALVSSLPLAILITYGLPYSLELTLYYVMGSLFGVLTLGKAKRVTSFFRAGAVIAASGIAVVISYRLPQPATDWIGVATLIGAALINGAASAGGTLILQFFLAQMLNMTTALQLMELSRPDQPLLQFLLRSAPGTYQHSLQVANLSEQAAEAIGADALLTRVGALYHDAGKAVDPFFYIENQVPGELNPHDDLDPTVSAAAVIRHVHEGVELARKFRLPRRIQEFIIEHHGDMLAGYQYCNAVKAAGGDESQVEKEKFRYPGPRPQSCETALLMLADGCEAKVRAEHPKDENELRQLIRSVIDNRVGLGELDDTDLTLRDLQNIEDSFTTTLRGIYHPRLQYPRLEDLRLTPREILPGTPALPTTTEVKADPSPPTYT